MKQKLQEFWSGIVEVIVVTVCDLEGTVLHERLGVQHGVEIKRTKILKEIEIGLGIFV